MRQTRQTGGAPPPAAAAAAAAAASAAAASSAASAASAADEERPCASLHGAVHSSSPSLKPYRSSAKLEIHQLIKQTIDDDGLSAIAIAVIEAYAN